MKKVSLDEVMGLTRYEQVRDDFRRRIIALKKQRRVPVGDHITFVFENRDTVLFQIQEMLRAERITDLDKVRFEVEVYNELIPDDGELSATMLIEITEQERIRPELVRLIGIENAVSLRIGEQFSIPAIFEAGRSKEDNLSAVQYVRFALPPESRQALRGEQLEAAIVVSHPNYQAHAVLPSDLRRALASEV